MKPDLSKKSLDFVRVLIPACRGGIGVNYFEVVPAVDRLRRCSPGWTAASSASSACQSSCRRSSCSSVPVEVLVFRVKVQIKFKYSVVRLSLVPPRIFSASPVPEPRRSASSLGPSASWISDESAAAPPTRSSAAPTVKVAVILPVNRRPSARLSGRNDFVSPLLSMRYRRSSCRPFAATHARPASTPSS